MERKDGLRFPVRGCAVRRSAAITMAAVLALSFVPAVAADQIGDSVTPTYDEAYYATLDYYGNLTDGSVVKSYILNGAASLTDYGDYDQINNLTDGTQPSTADGKIVFQFDQKNEPDHFYFEGKTAKPFEALPWTVSMSYQLNGVATKAEDLAGKTGLVEIGLNLVPNKSASEYARDNYVLVASTVFNQDDILSLKAEGAQVQLIGNLRLVMFTALPGEEEHFTVEVGSKDFSFDGMTFLMVPATLAQLDQIAELGKRKNELEDDYDKLNSSLDTLLDSVGNMSGSLYSTADGLDELDGARGTISAGKGEIYGNTDKIREDLDAMSVVLTPMTEQINAAGTALTDTKTQLQTLTDLLTSLHTQTKNLRSAIADAKDSGDDLREMLDDISNMQANLRSLQKALAAMGSSNLISTTVQSPSEALTQAKSLNGLYQSVADSDGSVSYANFMAAALMAGGKAASVSAAQATAAQMEYIYNLGETAATAAGYGDTWTTASGLHDAWATASIDDFQSFAYGILLAGGDSSAQSDAKQLSGLYSFYAADPEECKFMLDTMDTLITSMNTISSSVNSSVKSLANPSANLLSQVDTLMDQIDVFYDLLNEAETAGSIAKVMTEKGDSMIDTLAALDDSFNKYEPTAQETLKTVQALSENASVTIQDTGTFIGSLEALLQKSGTQLDSGTKKTLEGLAATLREAAKSTSKTGDVKSAKGNINSIIEDTWNEHSGDLDNLLNMDSTAAAVSITSASNPAPTSIQVLMRTQEITVADQEDTAQAETKTDNGTFWSRVGRMFEDFWDTVTGVFH